jgi:hypothetical protein
MPTGLEQLTQFAEETIEELLQELPPVRLLKSLPAEELIKGFTLMQSLKALSPKERADLAKLLEADETPDVKPE